MNQETSTPLGERMSLADTYRNKSLLILGGTGFLGKVWWTLLLHRFPDIEQLYLVVRSRTTLSSEDRFWSEVAQNPGLDPLRRRHGDRFEDFLRRKVTVLDGDIIQPFCGIEEGVRQSLRGKVHAVANASGIVDFQPPLDVALEVNAFGCRNLVALARDLGDVPIMHTSTCFVAGYRTGVIEEQNPLELPFPFVGKLERAHWDPEREVAECLDIIEQAKHRAGDAFRQSAFVDQAKRALAEQGEPTRGAALDAEVAAVRRRFVEGQLSAFGLERAQYWGWPNTYTYTKSIGEQLVAGAGLPFCIVRPAIVESCVAFPHCGWNEGINTSAPLIYAIREGQPQFPGGPVRLDVIPCDMVATGMVLSLAELLRGEAKPVYQYGTGDSNPISMARIYELSGLYKRKHFLTTGRGSRLENRLQRHLEGAFISADHFERYGPKMLASGAKWLAGTLDKTPHGPLSSLASPSARSLRRFARQQEKVAHIIGQFIPFTAQLDYEFRCDNTRAAVARLSPEEAASFYWAPQDLDWRQWFLEVHAPGLERWVFPNIDRKLKKPLRPIRPHATLADLLDEVAARFDLQVALQKREPEGFSRVTYRDVRSGALAFAERFRVAGLRAGKLMVLAGAPSPAWVMALFGAWYCGAEVVLFPAEQGLDLSGVCAERGACVLATDPGTASAVGEAVYTCILEEPGEVDGAALTPESELAPNAIACHVWSDGAWVSATHGALTNLLASLAPLFELNRDDRMLAALPLTAPFELVTACLLPLSRGARVVFSAGRSVAEVAASLRDARITALVGDRQLWREIEQEVLLPALPHAGLRGRWLEQTLAFNRGVFGSTGLDAGRLLFADVHRALGGHLRLLISGDGELDTAIAARFAGSGLPLVNGYGRPGVGALLSTTRAGGSAVPIPAVELCVRDAGADGVGAVYSRGAALHGQPGPDGWADTGDMGRIGARGDVQLLGPRSEVIANALTGNVYPVELERRLLRPRAVAAWRVVAFEGAAFGVSPALVVVLAPGFSKEPRVASRLERTLQRVSPAERPVRVVWLEERPPEGIFGSRSALANWLVETQPAPATEVLVRALAPCLGGPTSAPNRATALSDLGLGASELEAVAAALPPRIAKARFLEEAMGAEFLGDLERAFYRACDFPGVRSPADSSARGPWFRGVTQFLLGACEAPALARLLPTRVVGSSYLPRSGAVLVVATSAGEWSPHLVRYVLSEYRAQARVLLWEGDLPAPGLLRRMLLAAPWLEVVASGEGASGFGARVAALLERGQCVAVLARPGGPRPVEPEVLSAALSAAAPIVPLRIRTASAPVETGHHRELVRRGAFEATVLPPVSLRGAPEDPGVAVANALRDGV